MTLNCNTVSDLLAGEKIHLRWNVDLQVCYSLSQTPLLVFLHDALGNRFNWRSQYEFFQSQDQEVLAYGLARHRQSRPYQRYSLERHRRDLIQLLQNFHIQVLILCCHSYGIPLALEWAGQNPASALITINGDTHDLDPWWDLLMKFLGWGGKHLYRFPKVQQLTDTLCSAHRYDVISGFLRKAQCQLSGILIRLWRFSGTITSLAVTPLIGSQTSQCWRLAAGNIRHSLLHGSEFSCLLPQR